MRSIVSFRHCSFPAGFVIKQTSEIQRVKFAAANLLLRVNPIRNPLPGNSVAGGGSRCQLEIDIHCGLTVENAASWRAFLIVHVLDTGQHMIIGVCYSGAAG